MGTGKHPKVKQPAVRRRDSIERGWVIPRRDRRESDAHSGPGFEAAPRVDEASGKRGSGESAFFAKGKAGCASGTALTGFDNHIA